MVIIVDMIAFWILMYISEIYPDNGIKSTVNLV